MRRSFTKLAALAAMLSAISIPASRAMSAPTQQRQANKDIALKEVVPVKPIFKRNAFGGYGEESFKAAGIFHNQRQYRKRCRHNPSKYGSKKHRKKNLRKK